VENGQTLRYKRDGKPSTCVACAAAFAVRPEVLAKALTSEGSASQIARNRKYLRSDKAKARTLALWEASVARRQSLSAAKEAEREARRAARDAGIGCVYFLEGIGTGRVKIGWSSNLRQRIHDLSTSAPYELRLLSAPSGCTMEDEKMLHEHFKEFRVSPRKEWFFLEGPLLSFIEDSKKEPQDAYTG
jgi:T5orf172 domain